MKLRMAIQANPSPKSIVARYSLHFVGDVGRTLYKKYETPTFRFSVFLDEVVRGYFDFVVIGVFLTVLRVAFHS